MLLCGSFQNQVIPLINMLRFDEKQLSRANEAAPGSTVELGSDFRAEFCLEDEEELQNESISEVDEDLEDDFEVENSKEENEAGSINRKDWRRVGKDYVCSKQYIFVAATLPVNGKKNCWSSAKTDFSRCQLD